MKEFVLFFRMDITSEAARPSKNQMSVYMSQWTEWIDSIAAKGQLAGGNHLSAAGKLLKAGAVIEDGPYTRNGESVAGYIAVHARSVEEAVSIAENCPILHGKGTSVEIREIADPGN